jgi:hypothetical protein
VSGYKTESYTVNDTRYYYSLPSRDLSQISKSVVKNGVTLNFAGISWSDNNSADAGGTAAGSLFTATVQYTGKGTRQVPSDYIVTVVYTGEVTREITESITHNLTYSGEAIPEPFNPVPLAAGSTAGGGLVGAFLFFFFKRNTQIYNMQNGKYVLIGKTHLNTISPTVKLDNLKHKTITNLYRIALDKSIAAKLSGRDVTVSCGSDAVRHAIKASVSGYTFDVTIGGK